MHKHRAFGCSINLYFILLNSTFKDPNSIRLTKCVTVTMDITAEGTRLLFLIYFTYVLGKKERFSKVFVFRDSVRIDIFNEVEGEPLLRRQISKIIPALEYQSLVLTFNIRHRNLTKSWLNAFHPLSGRNHCSIHFSIDSPLFFLE